jgi:hypothetical protein
MYQEMVTVGESHDPGSFLSLFLSLLYPYNYCVSLVNWIRTGACEGRAMQILTGNGAEFAVENQTSKETAKQQTVQEIQMLAIAFFHRVLVHLAREVRRYLFPVELTHGLWNHPAVLEETSNIVGHAYQNLARCLVQTPCHSLDHSLCFYRRLVHHALLSNCLPFQIHRGRVPHALLSPGF